ncbi:uncharacterized protein [Ptychodera flava]|uniref:uncharacterized protein n=1 Tax=Ptychodera flava TaxID=63121 RepID=UPI003969D7E5
MLKYTLKSSRSKRPSILFGVLCVLLTFPHVKGRDCYSDADCNDNGLCESYRTGKCFCNRGFRGKHCEESYDCLTSRDCNWSGLCRNEVCNCFDGFNGTHCEVQIARTTTTVIPDCSQREDCNGNGLCIEGTCYCYSGYSGRHCQVCRWNCYHDDTTMPILTINRGLCSDPNRCGEHGRCYWYRTKCECDYGFYGDNCERSKLLEDAEKSDKIKSVSLIVIYTITCIVSLINICVFTGMVRMTWDWKCRRRDPEPNVPWWQQQSWINRRNVVRTRTRAENSARISLDSIRRPIDVGEDDGGFRSSPLVPHVDHHVDQPNFPEQATPHQSPTVDMDHPPSYTAVTGQRGLPSTTTMTSEQHEVQDLDLQPRDNYVSGVPLESEIPPPPTYETALRLEPHSNSHLGQLSLTDVQRVSEESQTLESHHPDNIRPEDVSTPDINEHYSQVTESMGDQSVEIFI